MEMHIIFPNNEEKEKKHFFLLENNLNRKIYHKIYRIQQQQQTSNIISTEQQQQEEEFSSNKNIQKDIISTVSHLRNLQHTFETSCSFFKQAILYSTTLKLEDALLHNPIELPITLIITLPEFCVIPFNIWIRCNTTLLDQFQYFASRPPNKKQCFLLYSTKQSSLLHANHMTSEDYETERESIVAQASSIVINKIEQLYYYNAFNLKHYITDVLKYKLPHHLNTLRCYPQRLVEFQGFGRHKNLGPHGIIFEWIKLFKLHSLSRA